MFCSQNFFGFGQTADIKVELDGAEDRQKLPVKLEDGQVEKQPLYYDGETVSGKVSQQHCVVWCVCVVLGVLGVLFVYVLCVYVLIVCVCCLCVCVRVRVCVCACACLCVHSILGARTGLHAAHTFCIDRSMCACATLARSWNTRASLWNSWDKLVGFPKL